MTAAQALAGLWQLAGLPGEALRHAHLTGADPVLPSSFAVGTAAQAAMAAATLAACELGHARGVPRQDLHLDMAHAAAACMCWFALDGRTPALWDAFSGLYAAQDGWVRVHANFAHHREGALRLLGLDPAHADRAAAERAMAGWSALDFEQVAAEAGLVAAALRSFPEWDATSQGRAVAAQPLFTIERVGDADPLPLPPLHATQRPLSGVRVLELTRILAGPVGGRALAADGADVLLVNAPHLPNIEAIAETSRGKLSAHADLRKPADRAAFDAVLRDAHVLVQGYRPGALRRLGYGVEEVAAQRPGIVYISLSAYGPQGPWRERRGFDSLLQTAMGFNHAEGEAQGDGKPKALPLQILDEAAGYLIAFGAAAALRRQQQEGGSWHVQVSLAQTAQWLRGLGRVADGLGHVPTPARHWAEEVASGLGLLQSVRHPVALSRTPAGWERPSMPPGSHPLRWP